MLVRIPKRFLDDHAERDLDTPKIERSTSTHYWVNTEDPALDELVSDAEHYAEGGVSTIDFPHLLGIVASAKATLRALRSIQ